VSIELAVIGTTTKELEDLLRPAYGQIFSGSTADLLRLAQPGSKCPRVIVLDVRKRHEVPTVLSVLKKEHQSTGVVIVADKLDPALMLEAMRAGVGEWVVDPVKKDELVAAVERAAGNGTRAIGQVFAVVGAKGGVGATTIAVNVATSLSSVRGTRTLLIDLHPASGDAALFLGVDPSFSMTDALENTHRLDEAFLKGIVVKTSAGPDLLASPDRAFPTAIDPKKIRAVLEFASCAYHYVVLDVPRAEPSCDDALNLAGSITVVATQELSAIRSASRMAAAFRQRHGASKIHIVVNRYDHAADIGSGDLERAVGGRIGHKFPSNYRLAIDALNKGRPIVVDNHNKLASSITTYARSLTDIGSKAASKIDRSTGFFGRLTGRG
jgi:pilus assembly protein CpaE